MARRADRRGRDEEGDRRRSWAATAGPRQVGEQYKKVVAQREVRRTLERIEEAGAKVAYFPVNITDGKAVADLLHQVRVKFGPVTALVHGAGVLADKRIEDLTGEQFDHVYSTKVDGLRTLLDLLGPRGTEGAGAVQFDHRPVRPRRASWPTRAPTRC